MYILGISAYYHDSAAVLLHNGQIVAAAQEERFSRQKHDPRFPENAVRFCLEKAGIGTDSLEVVAFYDKPFLKFERLLETYYDYAPRGWRSFIASVPVWVKEKLFLKDLIRKELEQIGPLRKDLQWMYPEHHLSHAASTFFPSPFSEAAILTIDGVGEWSTASIARGEGNSIRILEEMHFPNSLGLLYSAFTYYLGFRVNSGEYKLMGLAPYGDPESQQTIHFKNKILSDLIELYSDGSCWLNPAYFQYATGLSMTKDEAWEKLFGLPRRREESRFTQAHADLALAIQQVTEEGVLRMAAHAVKATGCKNLVLSGGVALNCVANGKLLRSGIAENLWIQPAAGDAGGALGAALAAWHIGKNQPRNKVSEMSSVYLGSEYGKNDIRKVLDDAGAIYEEFDDESQLLEKVAGHLSDGLSCGWFQGQMEWGPRALGNRSVLADPRAQDMQKKLNLQVKFREGFRPFAPAVPEEDAGRFFDLEVASPYMLLVAPVRDYKKPERTDDKDLLERLYAWRGSLPAVTHVDGSARVQTVREESNGRFYRLLKKFGAITGVPVLINTSFNVRGEPIVEHPKQAWECFLNTGLDMLVIGDFLLLKKQQKEVGNAEAFKKKFGGD